MRVGLFTYGMDETITGIGRYAIELSRALRRLDPDLEIVLLNPYPGSTNPWYGEFESYPVPRLRTMPLIVTAGHRDLHRAAVATGVDILHDPCGVAPFLVPVRRYARITTVHDAIPYLYPETQPLLTRLIFRTLVPAARFSADAVLTVSASAAEDLHRLAGIPRAKLHVTPNGVARTPPLPRAEREAVLDALGVRPPFFLYVGALNPRKNLARVIEAFGRVRARRGGVQLALVGPTSWGADGVARTVARSAAADRGVVAPGFVSDRQLQALYEGARALVFPSLYEGFGLPALEAMACGTPVLSSDVSALPEVVGDAGILVDPRSVDAIAGGLERLLGDDALHARLRRRCAARADAFSWERTARATRDVYRRVLAGR